jgi:hypothetical protein
MPANPASHSGPQGFFTFPIPIRGQFRQSDIFELFQLALVVKQSHSAMAIHSPSQFGVSSGKATFLNYFSWHWSPSEVMLRWQRRRRQNFE